MLKNLKKKLNSNSGVSILMALLAFLVAAMVSAVVVSAALSAAQAVRNDYDEEQAFLTVESAEKMIEQDMTNGSLKRSSSGSDYKADQKFRICGTILNDLLESESSSGSLKGSYTISVSNDDHTLADVEMDFSLDPDTYDVTASFQLVDKDTNKNNTNPTITAVFRANVADKKITWNEPKVTNQATE